MRTEKDPLPELVKALGHQQAAARLTAVRGLGRLGPLAAEAAGPLRRLTNDPDPHVREAAVAALGQMGPAVLPVLRDAVQHPDRHVRRQAVWALARLGPAAARAVPELCQALRDADQRTAAGAAQALGAIGMEAYRAVPALIEAMHSSNMVLSRLAAKSLSQIGPVAIPNLLEALVCSDGFVRGEAALAIGWMGAAAHEAVRALSLILYSRPDAAAAGLPGGRRPAVPGDLTPTVATLIVPCKDAEDSTRVYAAQALGKIGPAARAALPALEFALEDPNLQVRKAAEQAIAQICGRRVN